MSKYSPISDYLAEKCGLTLKDADKFLSLMFEVIGEGLQNDRLVKVKGFGTFKVQRVNARESVDVNTGERIIIEGRDKITFTPDATMRDIVNAPFAQFETVVLRDGVDFSQIDAKAEAEETQDEDSEEENPESETIINEETQSEENAEKTESIHKEEPADSNEIPVEERNVTTPEKVAEDENSEVNDDATINSPNVQSEEEPISSDIQDNESIVAEDKPSHTNSEEPAKDVVEETSTTEKETEENEEPYQPIYDESDYEKDPKRYFIWAIIGIIVLGCFGAYYFHSKIKEKEDRIERLENKLQELKNMKATTANEKTDSSATNNDDSIKKMEPAASKNDTQTPSNDATKGKPNIIKPSDKKKDVSAPISMNHIKAQVRTGAYKIVGVAQTVKVKKGQTLKSISKTYLGSGMECYVASINGVSEVTEGQKIKIPKLQLKKK